MSIPSSIFPAYENILLIHGKEEWITLHNLAKEKARTGEKEREEGKLEEKKELVEENYVMEIHVPPKTLVKISGMGDFSKRYFQETRIQFTNAEAVMVCSNDKNWIYYWFDRNLFPNATEIYFFDHPCEYASFHWFSNPALSPVAEKTNIYMTSHLRWTDGNPQIYDARSFLNEWIRQANQIPICLSYTNLEWKMKRLPLPKPLKEQIQEILQNSTQNNKASFSCSIQ